MLEISRALVMRPNVLLVDEPSIGPGAKIYRYGFLEIFKRSSTKWKEDNYFGWAKCQKKVLEFADIGYVLVSGQTAIAGKGTIY